MSFDQRHKWVFERVANAFDLEVGRVQGYVERLKLGGEMEKFWKENGPKKMFFFYQAPVHLGMRGSGKSLIMTTSDPVDTLTGDCLYFLHVGTKAVTKGNIDQEVVSGIIPSSFLGSLQELLSDIMLPVLARQANWGEISNKNSISDFIVSFRKFVSAIRETNASLKDAVTLKQPTEPKILAIEAKPSAFLAASHDYDVVYASEENLKSWVRQIETVLAQSDQVREESDDVGPEAELEYWKARMAKFNSITDQLKTPACRTVLGVCQACRSQLLREWRVVDARVTDAANEAKDNVKYLYTLERILGPLYKNDPVQMIDSIPGLINAIQMMHGIARYYNTSERMTALFVKITNQMIVCCKNYIKDAGKIWDQKKEKLIEGLRACIGLNDAYQEQYRATKYKLQTQPKAPQFDFSEAYIFGNFDAFCRRLTKLIDLFKTIQQFSTLSKSTVEGMDVLLKEFDLILKMFQNTSYDLLDHRDHAFEADYVVFNRKIDELEGKLRNFIEETFRRINSTAQALQVMKQFQVVLQRESLKSELESKISVIFGKYGQELERIKRLYETHKDRPPVPRNMPPVAGNIAWARRLLRCIEDPMEQFQLHPHILQSKESRKIIRTYNRLAQALIEFERLWFRGWSEAVSNSKAGLHATLLVRHPKTNKLYVNFDPQIIQLISETKALVAMDMDVPEAARHIGLHEKKLKYYRDALNELLGDVDHVVDAVRPIYSSIMQPMIDMIEARVRPGLVSLTWSSMNIEGYLAGVRQILGKVEEASKKANDILDVRIEPALEAIQSTRFLYMPSQPMDLLAYYERHRSYVQRQALDVEKKSESVEGAVKDLVNFITVQYSDKVLSKVSEEVGKFEADYEERTFVATRNAICESMRVLWWQFPQAQESQFIFIPPGVLFKTFFKIDVELSVPNLRMNPSFTEAFECLTEVVKLIVQSTKHITNWGQERYEHDDEKELVKKENLVTYYERIGRSTKVLKLACIVNQVMEGMKERIEVYLNRFHDFDHLWQDDKNKMYEDFLATKPTLEDFESEIKKYEEIENDIKGIHSSQEMGVFSFSPESLKYSLLSEASAWKQRFGQNLNGKARSELQGLMEFMEDTGNKLSRKIADLVDVKEAMFVLSELREVEAEIDYRIVPIEETYEFLARYSVRISNDERELVDQMRYKWKKLVTQAGSVQDHLNKVQSTFKKELLSSVKSFKVDVETFYADYVANGPNVKGIKPRVAVERLNMFKRGFEERERKWDTYSNGEDLFGMPVTQYPDLVKLKKEFKLLNALYGLYTETISTIGGYEDILWVDLDFETISNQVLEFQNRCRRLPKGMRDWEAFHELKKTIDDFNETLPLLQALAHPAVKDRHWDAIGKLTKKEIKIDPDTFKLKNLMDLNMLEFNDDVEDICNGAVKEAEIEDKLRNVIEKDWKNQEFQYSEFKNRGELILKPGETSEIIVLLEDSQMLLGSLMSNRYNLPFKKEIVTWVQKLSTASEVIEQWLSVQALWIYLEAVFSGGDIAKQLPQEAKRFANIDKSWVKIMGTAVGNPNVVLLTYSDETLRSMLPHLMEQLEICQKSLSGYLEQKRNLFPRFYFVSDPVLLEILGQASDPHSIQAHLKSIFDNIVRVDFDKVKRNEIVQMYSGEDEAVPMSAPVVADSAVEIWLDDMVEGMRTTVKDIARDSAANVSDMPLAEFIDKYPAQITLLGVQIMWTRDCEDAIKAARSDKTAMATTNKRIGGVLGEMVELTKQDLGKRDRTKLETLITIQVHNRDVFDALYRQRIRSITDFEWQKQARFYWKVDQDNCIVSVTDIDFDYCYEYLGCMERLCITPLTDRCYITLSQALGMYLGGAPAGPAGTGKTETVKDMGRTLGKPVVVFNCSDQMDYRGMGKIFKGLAQSGSWGDFDEFNRIELEVISVVAQQIACMLNALRERKKQFVFVDGSTVSLDNHTGVFITMNPGYAGRTELPENLKALFRNVAMMVPDRQIIMRVKLAAAGFQENANLAKKFFILYRLCEEQLSAQRHYDFGLRNILSVLRTSGSQRRSCPEMSESEVLMRVLRDMNLSKLVDEDEPLFLSLINDLFPGKKVDKETYPELEAAIADQVKQAGLVQHPDWVSKVVQFYEQTLVRHGIMVLGPSGAGKTRCIEILAKSLSATGIPHKITKMNPLAITASQMFGKLDVATNDWTDGIFAALWRRACKEEKYRMWLTLDGPVDPMWIENLNTVLDDNRTLTLANSDRIPMSNTMKLIFEVHSLENATPATVSRAGMIYMSASALGWKPLVEAWYAKHPPARKDAWKECFEGVVDKIYGFLLEDCEQVMSVPEQNQVQTMLTLLDGIFPNSDMQEQLHTPSKEILQRSWTYTMIWSLGGLLESKDRKRFEEFLRTTLADDLPLPACQPGEDIYEYFVDYDGRDGSGSGEWTHWSTRVQRYYYPADETPEFSTLVVPTTDNVRSEYLVDVIARQGKPVMLIGESGTAKTVTILEYLSKQNPDEMLGKMFNFSSYTTPNGFQSTIESVVEKRMGTTFGPPAGKKMMLFIDDVAMPEINMWGDQVTNEIVRQLLDEKGFYSLIKPGEFININDMQFLAAMPHPGGGRNDIPDRFKRQFAIFNLTLPAAVSVDMIFGTIVKGHFVEERGFQKEIIDSAASMTELTRIVWEKTKTKMLPTPAKFHYIFNLRDLSRITQGLINCESETVDSTAKLLQLWRHECERVLPDKFTNQQDIEWFSGCIKDCMEQQFGASLAQEGMKSCYYVDFMRDPIEPDDPDEDIVIPKVYEPVYDQQVIRERLEYYMEQYNEVNKRQRLDLVLFEEAVRHVSRISRIIRTPRGNALLVGVGGSGKQSLTRLASFIAGYQAFQITISKAYKVSDLLEDMKGLYNTAGVQGKGVTFLFTDNEIKEEGFLEYINSVLTSGEVPGLFPKDEIDTILSDLRGAFKKERKGTPDTNENLWKYFIDRVKDNLHVVLAFSPVGEKFRNRARKFPGLISGCTTDWFQGWPQEALVEVAQKFLSSFKIDAETKVKDELVEHMAWVHDMLKGTCDEYFQRFRRHTYVTPKSYLAFIQSYKQLYEVKRGEVGELANRINTGLNKLLSAADDVARMKVELERKNVELVKAQENTQVLLVEITASTATAEKVKAEVQVVKDELQVLYDGISKDKAAAEKDLAAAGPALKEAEEALDQIKPGDIATLKKLTKPPNLITRLMDGVLLLQRLPLDKVTVDMDFWPDRPQIKASWAQTVKMMSDSRFLQSLLDFERDSVDDEMCELMEPYLRMEDFTTQAAKKSSGNVAGICTWVKAMAAYHVIAKEVEPKRKRVREAEGELAVAQKDLDKAVAQLAEKQAALDELTAKYDAAMAEKTRLQEDADLTKKRMVAANNLINGLSGERTRWTEQSKEFEATIKRLVGDVALASAFMSYAGPFNQEFRNLLLSQWEKKAMLANIPCTKGLHERVTKFLTTESVVGEWNLQGLPTDDLSTQNGIIVTSADRYPLLIDPQGQAKTWIKNREGPNNLKITKLTDKYFRNTLEDCLSFGYPLLIEDVEEELDPVLDPILEKQLVKSGRGFKVRVGDKEVDFTDGFKVYVTTKLPNPHYTPETAAKTSMCDFTVTMSGLEAQLLGRVILKERAELEQERVELLEEVNLNKKKALQLEEDLLYRLSSSTGNLLDDETLIEVLATTKNTALEVKEKLEHATEMEKKINEARQEYLPVATRGSIMYFLIAEMANVNSMYQSSLGQFLKLFDEAIDEAPTSPITSKRIHNIIETSTFNVFKYISRGLFEKHKLLFTLMLALKIDMNAGKVTGPEFQCLLKGGAALDLNDLPKKPFRWIPDEAWLNLNALSHISTFTSILDQITRNQEEWKKWYAYEAPEAEEIPDGYEAKLNKFQRLLVVRSWRDDRTVVSASEYIVECIGAPFIESMPLDLEATANEAVGALVVPLICLLSQGSDPSSTIEGLGKKLKIKTASMSMGQGQEVHARRLVKDGLEKGGWLVLQNCHLGLKYMLELEETLVNATEVNPDFRLWITTDPSDRFPIGLLQMGIKITNEAPTGVKAGLRSSFAMITQDMLEAVDKPQWRPLLFTIAFIHTTLQERKRFGPLGWNVPYEFSLGDLTASIQFLQTYLYQGDLKKGISWPTVRYMICEVHYGGRITDDFDRRLMNTYGNVWLDQKIFQPTFQFYEGYKIPSMKTLTEVRSYIDQMPIVDSPEIFGMHPNAELTFRSNTAREIFDQIIAIQPKEGGGAGGETPEEAVDRMSEDMFNKLPPEYVKTQVKAKIARQGGLAKPLNVFLSQEIDRIQALLTIMSRTLADMRLAIAGTIIMSQQLQDTLGALYDARIPEHWLKASWPSSTLGFWLNDVMERCVQYTSWLDDGRPACYWMTGFFNPQGFLTAMRQEVTRAHNGWALDKVVLTTEVLKQDNTQISQPPEEGVYVHGLFLEGASWDRRNGHLVDAPPKQLFAALPVLHVSATNTPPGGLNRMYPCPVYRTPRRTGLNYIFDVYLPTEDAPSKWILRGVGLLCSKV